MPSFLFPLWINGKLFRIWRGAHCPLNNAPKPSVSHGQDVTLNKKRNKRKTSLPWLFFLVFWRKGTCKKCRKERKEEISDGVATLVEKGGGSGGGGRGGGGRAASASSGIFQTHIHSLTHSPRLMGKQVGEAENTLIETDACGTSQVEQHYAFITQASCFTAADCYASYGQLNILN